MMIMIEESEKTNFRGKVVSKGRTEMTRSIKNGEYFELEKEKYGVIDESELILDSEFLDSMIEEIEKSRERAIVYDYDFKRSCLDDWIRKNNRKLILREIKEKSKKKERNSNGEK